MQSLFPLKEETDCKSIVIYKGDCSCGSRYIGEIKRNAEVRFKDLRKTLESASTIVLHGLSCQTFKKMFRPGRN